MTEILQQDIQSLLEFFSKNMYRAKDSEIGTMSQEIMQTCVELMKQDYSVIEITNTNGELSSHYPSQILIPEYEIKNVNGYNNSTFSSATTSQRPQQTIYESTHDASKMRDLINKARFARCRARFPLPVILFKGKYVCRSATLSGGPEIYGRSGLDYLFFGVDTAKPINIRDDEVYEAQENSMTDDSILPEDELKEKNCDWQLFDRVRSQDIKLLKTLNVGTIVDFMVEKKKVKFGMNVTSSEKVDKEKRYSDFTIISLPYPGCEFFREYRDNNYSGEDLIFDWSQSHVDASIGVPEDSITSQLPIEWETYKMWDLVKITQNYLKLLLKYLHDNSTGLLIHCISGWDRTPLFVSLLRLSLWADGVIHQSLTPTQILYLTISYDWYLFGHNLPDRLSKGEEIFFFCFYILKYIMDDEFSILTQRYKSKHSSGSSSIGVLRTDSECMLDGILFDGESRGSSISLNSTCSCVSAKSHHDINISAQLGQDEIANGNTGWLANSHDSGSNLGCLSTDSSNNGLNSWPIQGKRTSPVSVPITNKLRQRQESSSSLSVGSWQMISGTGSLRSSDSNSVEQQQNHLNVNNSNAATPNANQISQESGGTIIDDDCFSSTYSNDASNARREKLTNVRSIFYHCYCSTVGFKFKNGADFALGTLLGNFAEKVGLAQRTSV